MNPCYDSSSSQFTCALKKVKCTFAENVYKKYVQERFGIKTCNNSIDVSDLKDLAEYIMTMDLSGFDENTYRNEIITNDCITGQVNEGCASEFALQTLKVCNISNIIEKINSL